MTGAGLVRPVLRVGALRRRKKTKKRSETKKSKKKKICTTVGWVDALLGGLGSSRLKARVACQKGGVTKKIFFSKKRSETKKDKKNRFTT